MTIKKKTSNFPFKDGMEAKAFNKVGTHGHGSEKREEKVLSLTRSHNNNNNNNNKKHFSGSEDCVGGDFVVVHSERSKKERLRELSVVAGTTTTTTSSSFDYLDCEMGCDNMSDNEDELRLEEEEEEEESSLSIIGSSKRFKVPKKFFDDCNGVDHASVPRKLRSATKKRNRESISQPLPDSKKLNYKISGVESFIKNGAKKSKLNMKCGSDKFPRKNVTGPITKDEEEVVETLYALAGMFPNNDASEKSKLDSESIEAKPSAMPVSKESPMPTLEDSAVTNDNLSSTPLITAEAANLSSNFKSSPEETAKVDSLDEHSVQEKHVLPESKKIHMESDCSGHQLNLHSMSFLANSESSNENPLRYSDLSLDTRLKPPTQPGTPIIDVKPEIALGPVITIGSQPEQQNVSNEFKKNGTALWPGLSSEASHGVGSHGLLQSSGAKIPGWLDTATFAPRHRSFENGSLTGKVSKVVNKKPWKRCATHFHISHLIQILNIQEKQERLPLQPNQLRPQEGSSLGVLMAINNFQGVDNRLNAIASSSNVCNSTAERNISEAKTGSLQHQRLHQDQPQAALASGAYNSQQQGFDFLSLSAGGGGVEAKNSVSRAGNGLDSSSQFQVPYLQSLAQQLTIMPFSMSQSRYTSSAYSDQLSVAPAAAHQVQLQLPLYLGSPLCGSNASPAALTKQQQHPQQQQQHLQQQQQHLHQQQQHQLFWTAQLAAQYKPVGTSTSMSQVQSWQQGRQDTQMWIPCSNALIPPPPSPLEVLGPKYTPLSQQQQYLMDITSSLPHARVKRQDHLLPSVYEETGGGFHASGALPLQLLCNERL
ncbi:hypothetical protein CMV_028713 [Castanea mollissima]|uniref:Uncharacterized protein n=1 Tax=Castanea mollissima TaxID=60419 RepID=A0A8J4QFS1_9ROSI|nr:hypothetical protein CMV_028713 [Castanea mollissima]